MSGQALVFKNPILAPIPDKDAKWLLDEMGSLGFMWGSSTTCPQAYSNLVYQSYDFMRMQLWANLTERRMGCYLTEPTAAHWARLTLVNSPRQFVAYCRRAKVAGQPPF